MRTLVNLHSTHFQLHFAGAAVRQSLRPLLVVQSEITVGGVHVYVGELRLERGESDGAASGNNGGIRNR